MARKGTDIPLPNLMNVHKEEIPDYFALMSDTHYGSKYCAEDDITEAMDDVFGRGIKTTYHSGDLTDGMKVYRGQEFNLSEVGFKDQSDKVVKSLPHNKNHTYKVVAGNHDLKYYQLLGADIVDHISHRRSDVEYKGPFFARVIDEEIRAKDGNPLRMDLVHPKRHAITMSYQAQKYIDRMDPSIRPHIQVNGHRHQSMYFDYGGVTIFEAGHFQHPNGLAARNGYSSSPSMWFVELVKDKKRKSQKKDDLVAMKIEKKSFSNWKKQMV